MDDTDESHQDYCPWVDETTGFTRKSSDGAREQVLIPKKMKKLIDGDLASLKISGKFSTKDRLRAKLRQKQQEREDQQIQESNNHEATDTNRTNSRKQRKRRKRSKKGNASEGVCINIANDEHVKNVREKQQECVQHLENTNPEENCFSASETTEINDEINFKKTDEGEEFVEESCEGKNEAGKAHTSYDDEMNEKIGSIDVKVIEKSSTIYGALVNISESEKVSGNTKYALLDQNVYTTAEFRKEDIDITYAKSFTHQDGGVNVKTALKDDCVGMNTNTRTRNGKLYDILGNSSMFGRKIDIFRKKWKMNNSMQICVLKHSGTLRKIGGYGNVLMLKKEFLKNIFSKDLKSDYMVDVLKMIALNTSLLIKTTKQDQYIQSLTKLHDNKIVCERCNDTQKLQVALTEKSKLENEFETNDEMTYGDNHITFREFNDDACEMEQLRCLSEIENETSVHEKIAGTVNENDETKVGIPIARSTKSLEVKVKTSSLENVVENVCTSQYYINMLQQQVDTKDNEMIQDSMRKRYAELYEMLLKYLRGEQTKQAYYLNKGTKMLTFHIKAHTDVQNFLLKRISWGKQNSKFETVPNSVEVTDVIANIEMLVLIRQQSFSPRAESMEAKYSIEIWCNNLKSTEVFKYEIPKLTINFTGPLAANAPRKISTVQRNDKNVVSIKEDVVRTLVGTGNILQQQVTAKKNELIQDFVRTRNTGLCEMLHTHLWEKQTNIHFKFFKKNMVKEYQNASRLEQTLQNKPRLNQKLCTLINKKILVVQQNFSTKKYLTQNDIQVKTVINDVSLDQSVKDGTASNSSVNAFLSKLHTVMFKKKSSANNDSILEENQRVAIIPPAVYQSKLILNHQKIDTIKPKRSVCLLETPAKKRVNIGEDPANYKIKSSDLTDQYNISTQGQEIDETSQERVLEVIEQSHYGIRLCIFD